MPSPLAGLLQVAPTPHDLYLAAFGYAIKLLDEVVAVVDDLVGDDGCASWATVLGGGE